MVVIHRTAAKSETCLTYFVHQRHGAGQHFGVSQAKEHHNAKNKGFGRRTQISDRTPLQKTRGIKPQNRRKPQGRTKLQKKIRLRVVKAAGYLSENLRLHEATAMVP